MSGQTGRDLKLEIAHVLFIDIVGYSKLLIGEQSDQIQTLREIVRATEQRFYESIVFADGVCSRIVRRWYYYRDNSELVELSALRHSRK